MEHELFNNLIFIWIGIAVIVFHALLFIKAPYGRHTTKKWGLLINNKAGWIIMELPALLIFMLFFLTGSKTQSIPVWIFFAYWVFHYSNRSIIYPLRTKTSHKKIPLLIVILAIIFNTVNGSINGYYFAEYMPTYNISWLYDPRFIIGSLMFIFGMYINRVSDRTLIRLRKPGETGYKIPKGGMFKLISCPNHFGEIVEWAGFAVLTWSLPAFAFALWTLANVLPRSLAHHKWYKRNFDNYPEERKAVIPYVL